MSDRDHSLVMLEMARHDITALRGMHHSSSIGKEYFSDEIFGFHAQQAVEKSLKSWLSFKGVKYPRTHDLMSLIDSLEDSGENVSDLLEFVDLNQFAVQYRYEVLAGDDPQIDRDQLLFQVQLLFDRVRGHVET